MATTGRRNLITDVEGVLVGNAGDGRLLSGTTVVVGEVPLVAGADIRGGAPGTREIEALSPENLVSEIHALVLSGGSVFGLDAASAVTANLARRGVGFRFGREAWPCPVVPAAILFDLANGGDKNWGEEPPYGRLGRAALAAAGESFGLGNAGAGLGAIAGAVKGGLGSASAMWNGYTVGALVAVNSVGSCIRADRPQLWAADDAVGEEMGAQATFASRPMVPGLGGSKLDLIAAAAQPGANTTIAVVATDARLDKAQARRLAIMAGDGLARAIRPVHTPFDGDTVFAMSTGVRPLTGSAPLALSQLGAMAATALARAVGRAVWEAASLGRAKSYRELIGA